MSFGDPNNPYNQQLSQGEPRYPHQAPQSAPPQYGYPQYAQDPYEAYPSAGMPGMWGAGVPPLAHWGHRVGAFVVDAFIIAGPLYALGFVDLARSDDPATAGPGPFFAIGLVYALSMGIFQLYKEGATGQTIGKKVLGISLRQEADGSTLGFGMAFVRKLAHFLDSVACYLGWLWPLWDSKKQTFADKVCSTVVIKIDRG
ncbi:RDD family protein [Streptomyces sp. NPDC056304]|uniref:RDD family protein n=1 Tax=Streptomyces sp. NPDC056304 TaxID=3345778 RepID=UPI0035E0FC19